MGLLRQSILRVDNIPGPLEEHAVALEELAAELGAGPAADLARLKAKMVRSWNGRRHAGERLSARPADSFPAVRLRGQVWLVPFALELVEASDVGGVR